MIRFLTQWQRVHCLGCSWRSFLTASLVLAVAPTLLRGDTATYDLVFDSTWSVATHPTAFPAGAHFSGTVGTTHSDDYSLWKPGELSTVGVQRVAELGASSMLLAEINAAIGDGEAYRSFTVSGLSRVPRSATGRVQADSRWPLISFASMIAPSPDWIVGGHDISLLDEQGNWIPQIVVEAIPYDAGTDSGADFSSANLATSPHEPIFRIVEAPFDGENSAPLGTFTLNLTSLPGDFDGSGAVDAGDISVLCFRLEQSHPAFELTGDDQIGMDDVQQLVERVMGTRTGDANLDGDVDFDDFLTVSGNFGEIANWTGGDFDCNREVDFNDFLILSESFGFQSGGDELVESVPEPTGVASLLVVTALIALRGRRLAGP